MSLTQSGCTTRIPSGVGPRGTGPGLCSRLGAAGSVALLVALGPACASAPVELSTNQVRAGVRAADQGYWEEAEFRWLKALAIDSRNARSLNNLAVRFERLGEFEKAKERYDRALAAATRDERTFVLVNSGQFEGIWRRIQAAETGTGVVPDAEEPPAGAAVSGEEVSIPVAPPGLSVVEVSISVPEEEGPNLAGFDRILIGNFIPTADSEVNLNAAAVQYFRRRIVQRTFFQTVDLLGEPLPSTNEAVLDDAELWSARAQSVEADLVLTGKIGLNFSASSRRRPNARCSSRLK